MYHRHHDHPHDTFAQNKQKVVEINETYLKGKRKNHRILAHFSIVILNNILSGSQFMPGNLFFLLSFTYLHLDK